MSNKGKGNQSVNIAERIFTNQDQINFADFSGDENPAHLSAQFSRRNFFGKQIVHGMHAALWALNEMIKFTSEVITDEIHIDFLKPIFLNHLVQLEISSKNQLAVTDKSGNKLVKISFRGNRRVLLPNHKNYEQFSSNTNPQIFCFEEVEVGKIHQFAAAGKPKLGKILFPSLSSASSETELHEIASLSKVIGIDLPGKYSIFISVRIFFNNSLTQNKKTYKLVKKNSSFRSLSIDFQGNHLFANLRAISPKPPYNQISLKKLRHELEGKQFNKLQSLIIGGSRGLGETTAKMICAGGGSSTITYSVSAREAKFICDEALEQNLNIKRMRLDIFKFHTSDLVKVAKSINTLFYYPTPKIFNGNEPEDEIQKFEHFNEYYCLKFEEILKVIAPINRNIVVFMPSSDAISNPIDELKIYIKSKLYAEQYCSELCNQLGIKLMIKRLPRIYSDQTQSLLSTNALPAQEVMKPILIEINKLLK